MPDTVGDQLVKHLTDVHSIETQALQQLVVAPRMAGDAELARAFRDHLAETRDQESRVRVRLEEREADPSRVKDLIARAGGIGMVLFARSQPDTPGKLVAHSYSYEHLELAAYDLLAIVAERAGDRDTAQTARSIREQEAAMAGRLAAGFDRAVDASVRRSPSEPGDQLDSYLKDAHAIESQALQFLGQAPDLAGDDGLRAAFEEHLEQTRAQQEAVAKRLEARGARPSRFRGTLLRVGGLNLAGFFGAQPDTPAKVAGFAFAFEHLEVAAYELLRRVAERAGDDETVQLATRIAGEERAAAETIRSRFEPAMESALAAQGVSG